MKAFAVYALFPVLCLNSAAAYAESHVTFWGGVDSRTYGETTYEPIPEIDLRSRFNRTHHIYEIRIPDVETGRGVICELVGNEGDILARDLGFTRIGELRFFFTSVTPNATANCSYVDVERLTRP